MRWTFASERPGAPAAVKIACLALSRIANFDDLDPLAVEPGVDLVMVAGRQSDPGRCCDWSSCPARNRPAAIWLSCAAQGWDIDLAAHVRRGGHVLGICGGYQMLGRTIADPDGIEGAGGRDAGPRAARCRHADDARTSGLTRIRATHAASGAPMTGYEIHIGVTEGPDRARPFAHVAGVPEGAISADGRIMGSYLHGMFAGDAFRAAFLGGLGASSTAGYGAGVEAVLEALADHMEANLDIGGILGLAR